jgi:hypothetical protein
VSNWVDTDCYDNGTLSVWLRELDGDIGTVCGIEGDDDWACRSAELSRVDSGLTTVVKRVTFRNLSSRMRHVVAISSVRVAPSAG